MRRSAPRQPYFSGHFPTWRVGAQGQQSAHFLGRRKRFHLQCANFRTTVWVLIFFLIAARACQYQHVLTSEEWEHVEYYSSFLEKTQLPLDHRKFCFELYSRLSRDQFCILSAPDSQFDDRGKAWYWRMMSVILLNSMFLLEKAMGPGETVVAYRLLRDLSANDAVVMARRAGMLGGRRRSRRIQSMFL